MCTQSFDVTMTSLMIKEDQVKNELVMLWLRDLITLKLFVNFLHEKVKRKVPGGLTLSVTL